MEYKGAHIAEMRDSREKKRIGEMWERRSGGRCAFAWVENEEWKVIDEAINRCGFETNNDFRNLK